MRDVTPDPLDFSDFDAFYAWLGENHDAVTEAQLFLYKKGYRDRGISYEDAVRAALCWGWIDSVTHRYDEVRFIQRFSPRKAKSNWSASNIRRVKALIGSGRMTEAGLERFDLGLIDRLGEVEAAERARREAPPDLPDACQAVLDGDPESAARFESLPPSHKRQYAAWIRHAKREATQLRRTQKMCQMLRDGKSFQDL